MAFFHAGLERSPSGRKSTGDLFASSCVALAYDGCGMAAVWSGKLKGIKVKPAPANAQMDTPTFQRAISKCLGRFDLPEGGLHHRNLYLPQAKADPELYPTLTSKSKRYRRNRTKNDNARRNDQLRLEDPCMK